MSSAARDRLIAVALAVIVAILVGACGSAATTPGPSAAATAGATDESPSDSASPSDTSSTQAVPESPVAGIVTAVDSQGLDQVKGFTVRTNDGETIEFTIGVLENGDEFPPGHLKEHQTTAAPILVFFNVTDGKLVVFRIEDAG